MDKEAILKSMTGETDEAVLSNYLALARLTVLTKAFPFEDITDETEVPAKYNGVHVEIAAYMLNKRGAEGETSHSENGVTRSYEDGDIPSSLLRKIVPMVKVL